jgi:hypothetical protein
MGHPYTMLGSPVVSMCKLVLGKQWLQRAAIITTLIALLLVDTCLGSCIHCAEHKVAMRLSKPHQHFLFARHCATETVWFLRATELDVFWYFSD